MNAPNPYRTGYSAAHRPGTTVANVEIPALYTSDQVALFLSGFLAGKRQMLKGMEKVNG